MFKWIVPLWKGMCGFYFFSSFIPLIPHFSDSESLLVWKHIILKMNIKRDAYFVLYSFFAEGM